MYTIQSTRNNTFIGSLFSDGHADNACAKEAAIFNNCKIVKIVVDNNN